MCHIGGALWGCFAYMCNSTIVECVIVSDIRFIQYTLKWYIFSKSLYLGEGYMGHSIMATDSDFEASDDEYNN